MAAIKQNIKKISKQRDNLLLEWEKTDFENKEIEDKIDILANQILELLKLGKEYLDIDFVIEELTKLGWAPCIVYDDNGHFAISGDGYQNISEEVKDSSIVTFVKKEYWKNNIREALVFFLSQN